jgi:hypothetical protein
VFGEEYQYEPLMLLWYQSLIIKILFPKVTLFKMVSLLYVVMAARV